MNEIKIENLWKWFIANEQQIIDSVENESVPDYIVENLDNLILDIGMFTWEIGPGKIKPWFLTISPNGDKDLIKVSQKIIDYAPDLNNWEYNYSKPAKEWDRKFTIYDSNMDEQDIDASNWKYVALPYEDDKIELILEAKNIAHLDNDTAATAANLFVTNEIGEENKIQKIFSVNIVDQLENEHDSRKSEINCLNEHLKKIILLLLIFILPAATFGQTKAANTEFNFGFENTSSNENLPDNWIQWGSGYNLGVDTTVKHSGKNSIIIEPSSASRTSNAFGCVAREIPAVYKGKKIEVRAWMKMKDVTDGPVGLLLRIDGTSGILKFDNMQKRKIQGTSDWTLYSVKLRYPKSAKVIYIGALLSGAGKLWVDDFELLIDGQDIKKAKRTEYKADKDNEFDLGSKIDSVKLSEEKLNDLKILGMVWGFLKYYHPGIAAGEHNWDYELFRILPGIIKAQDSKHRDEILSDCIKSLGNFRMSKNAKEKGGVKISPDLEWITNSNLTSGLVSQLLKVRKAKRVNENYYIDLIPGTKNPKFKNEKTYSEMKYPDSGFRLLSLYRYWNIIQYYFPYKNLIEEDWKQVLGEFIPKFIQASNEIEYKLTVLELIGRIHDTHASILGPDEALRNYRGVNYAPVEITFIENKVVVTNFYDHVSGKKSNLKIGDIITAINKTPIEEIILQGLKYTPASNYPTKLRNLAKVLLRTNDTIINVQIDRNGKTDYRIIETYPKDEITITSKFQIQDTCFKFISPVIAYLNPSKIKNEYLPGIMGKIQNTKGLIIDFRCYPSDFFVFHLGKYLMPAPTDFVKFSRGSITTPGAFHYKYTLKVGKKNKDYYQGKVVILINEITQSSAEYHTLAFKTAPKAMVIGSTTAGADGNVSPFYLPGKIKTMISGIGVYYPDGGETQRIGIVPDIEVKPTIAGIRQGKDELLDKAIEIINIK
ncbi:peptidase S41 [bacterium AH-315-C07]|nr:peptidase S41 [bacterium AH-315-C07]